MNDTKRDDDTEDMPNGNTAASPQGDGDPGNTTAEPATVAEDATK